VNLGSNGSGTRSRTVYGRIYPNQTTAPTGTFVSTFSGSNTQIDYGYSTSFSCSSSLSPRVQNVPFTVRLTNNASCTVNTTALNFGTQFNLSADRDATNTVTVNCTAGTAYTVGLSNGTGGGTGPTARRMTNSSTASYVTYGIFRDAARTQPWGDVSGTNTAAGTGDGTNQAFTGYGRVPPQVEPPTLTYTDTVVVTVTY
jgi:spore coat protein U-like protein